jgi:hypothetical protein
LDEIGRFKVCETVVYVIPLQMSSATVWMSVDKFMIRRLNGSVLWLVVVATQVASAATIEQIISREDPRIRCPTARLHVGRDGLVYLVNGNVGSSYVLRMKLDGTERTGGFGGSAALGVAANKDGVIGTANAHLERQFTLWDRNFAKITGVGDWLGNDALGFDAPGFVDAGASGDFYVLDHHRDRIVRVTPAGKVLQAYVYPREPNDAAGRVREFRVCEAKEAFFLLLGNGQIRCIGFDGKTHWAE